MIMKIRPRIKQIITDKAGVAALEFAFVAPVFFLLLMGIFDVGYAKYVKSVLQGAVENAGRAAALEATSTSVIDDMVTGAIGDLNNGSLQFSRVYYENYGDIKLAEDFTDLNNNGIRNPGECFVDRNSNARWDANVGLGGRGGAQDVVIYRATLNYDKIFPLWKFIGQPSTQQLVGVTQLRNQPFSAQASRVGVEICT